MAINKRLLVKPPSTGITPSEHFGAVLYEGDGSSSHSINGGKFGAAFYGNGSSSKIDIGNLNLGGDAERTISAWINTNSLSSTQTIFQYGANSNGARFGFSIDTSGKPFVEYYNRDVTTSSSHISVNTWYHLVVTYNGNAIETATNTQIYVNGSAVSMTTTGAQTGSANTTNSNYGIGYDRLNTRQYFSGKLDQVRIFQKALSSSEVSTLYAETASTVESLDPLSEDTTDTLQVLGDSSCIATYRFENNEDDLSGNYDGTGTEIQYAAGRYGQAASFNGTSSKVDITATASTPIDFSQRTFTISAWINGSGFTTDDRTIISKYNGSNNTGSSFFFDVRDSDQKLRVTEVNGTSALGFQSGGSVSENTWTHVVYVRTTTTCEFFINGSSSGGSQSRTTALNAGGTTDISIGERQANKRFIGKIDQVRIFNKALSASEVTTLYNENSLVASYRFEGNANDDTRNYDGTASNVTYEYGLGFTPDFVWLKNRDNAGENHSIYDNSRTLGNPIYPNLSLAEGNPTNKHITSLDTGGFTLGTTNHNADGDNYVGWCLKANGGTTSSNTDGNITSTVQVNETAAFSIITYTGTGGSGKTIGHGLGVEPSVYFTKRLNSSDNWRFTAKVIEGYELDLSGTSAKFQDGAYPNYATSSIIKLGTGSAVNTSGGTYVTYCFAPVEGFSSFGSYTGNASDDGPIVETGFEPSFVMVKRTDSAGSWFIHDNKRDLVNPRKKYLLANASNVEASDLNGIDFFSNGFQIIDDYADINASGGTFIYMAFAADPDTEQPTVAKSFNTITWSGDGTSDRSFDGLGFQPSLVWAKVKSGYTFNHTIYDSVRGPERFISSDSSGAERVQDSSGYLTSFDSDGFSTTGGSPYGNEFFNKSGGTYVAWAWKADDNEPTIFGGPALAVYKFEDNANDVTGNYNATATNITYSSSGKFNKSAIFDGTSRISTSLDFDTYDENWSISYWIKFTFDTNYRAILGSTDSNAYNGMVSDIGTSGELRFRLRNTSSSVSSLSSTATYGDGNWHHVVCVKGSSTNYLYIDGQLDSSTSTTNGVNHSALNFGAYGLSTTNDYFKGELDQVRIYNGALAQEQVTKLYNETASQNNDLTLGAPAETIISANANAGFSIVKYEGTGVSGRQVPHGLSAAPEMVIIKNLDSTVDWRVGHTSPGWTKFGKLNKTDAFSTNSVAWNDTAPSSTVVTLGTSSGLNSSGVNYIMYAFHSVSGFSKFGSYTGNGTAGHSITGLGFQPDWIMIKTTTFAHNWVIADSVRGDQVSLFPNLNNAESDQGGDDLVSLDSNGFTVGTNTRVNSNGDTFIYAAFKIN